MKLTVSNSVASANFTVPATRNIDDNLPNLRENPKHSGLKFAAKQQKVQALTHGELLVFQEVLRIGPHLSMVTML